MITKNYLEFLKGFEQYMLNLLVISTLANVKMNYKYVVYDHSILKHTKGNRGGGIEKSRVNYYVNLIKTGKFDFDMCVIAVDMNGNIVEGHHRFEAMKILCIPVVIDIKPEKTLAQISCVNSGISQKWRSEQAFQSAITNTKNSGCTGVIELDKYRGTLIEKFGLGTEKTPLNISKISACEMYGIVMKNTKFFGSGKNAPTVDMWENSEFDKLVGKGEYKKLLKVYARMKSALKSNRDAYKVCKYVMDLHFNDKDEFDVFVFIEALSVAGFIMSETYNAANIKAKAMSMYKKQCKVKLIA